MCLLMVMPFCWRRQQVGPFRCCPSDSCGSNALAAASAIHEIEGSEAPPCLDESSLAAGWCIEVGARVASNKPTLHASIMRHFGYPVLVTIQAKIDRQKRLFLCELRCADLFRLRGSASSEFAPSRAMGRLAWNWIGRWQDTQDPA